MKPKIRLGRRFVVPVLAAWLLAGCAAEQAPQWSARPAYYAPPQAPPYYDAEPQAPDYAPPVYYARPAPVPRYVRPTPPVSDEPPQQADIAPPAEPAPPTYERADPCIGWWRVCHLWD
jgi:hypothetical protein